jgi:hypothetical protein
VQFQNINYFMNTGGPEASGKTFVKYVICCEQNVFITK